MFFTISKSFELPLLAAQFPSSQDMAVDGCGSALDLHGRLSKNGPIGPAPFPHAPTPAQQNLGQPCCCSKSFQMFGSNSFMILPRITLLVI